MKVSLHAIYGVILMSLFACAAYFIAQAQWLQDLSISPLIVGIIVGMFYANTLRNRLPETWVPGIKFCTKQILRWGIILYGFRLTFQQVVEIGASAIIIDVIIICGVMLVGILAGKLLKMDSDTTLMVSTGSAICGAAAVLGAEPVVKCAPYKTAIAVSTVVIFGTISMFLYPVMYRTGILGLSPEQMAIFSGSTLHEVAHVVGAGNAMDFANDLGIVGAATITKMIRVMLLAPLLVIMGFILSKARRGKDSGSEKTKITIPWFAFGFLLVIGINSILLLCVDGVALKAFTDGIQTLDNFMLTMAMTALGAETSFAKFRQAGAKPFYLAAIIWIFLLTAGYTMARFV